MTSLSIGPMLSTIGPSVHTLLGRKERSLYYWHNGKLCLKKAYRVVQAMDECARNRKLPARPSLAYLDLEAKDLKRAHFGWQRIYLVYQKINHILEARQMNRDLPEWPSLEYLRKEAKRIKKVYRYNLRDPEIFETIRLLKDWKDYSDEKILETKLTVTMAQWATAIRYGFTSWHKLKEFVVQSRQPRKDNA